MIYLSLSGQNITIKPIAGQEEKEDIKKLIGLKVSPKIPIYKNGEFAYWEVNKSALPIIFDTWTKDKVMVDKKAQSLVDAFLFNKVPLKDLPKETLTILPKDGRILEDYQEEFATYSYNKKNLLIFDDTGSGKCTSMLVRAVNTGFRRLLVITTKNNFPDWERDSRAVLGISPIVYSGTPKQRAAVNLQDAQIILTNYEQVKFLRKQIEEPDFFDGIILDEAHNCASPSSDIHDEVEKLLKANKNRKLGIGSTATPFDGDNLVSIWGLIKLVDPVLAGDKQDFVNNFMQPVQHKEIEITNDEGEVVNVIKKAIKWKTKNVLKLKKLLAAIAHRSDISKSFKFKDTHEIIPLEMTAKQKSIYESILDEYEQELDQGTFFQDNPLAKCARLFKVTEFYRDDNNNIYSTKHDWCVEYFSELKKTGERCVFWSSFIDPTKTLWNKFKDCGVIYCGEMSDTYKRAAKIAFAGAKDREEEEHFYEVIKNLKDFPFKEPASAQFIFQVGARRSGEGANYQIADRQIISSVNVSGRVTKQMIGRIKRKNSEHKEIFTKFLAIRDSIDIRFINLVLDKMSKVSDILDGRESEISIKAREIVDLFREKVK